MCLSLIHILVFFKRRNGQYIMHRIHHVKPDGYYIVGDAQCMIEGPVDVYKRQTYKKPLLVIENFKLSENIAACDPSFGNNSNITLEDIQKAYNVLGYFADGVCENCLLYTS